MMKLIIKIGIGLLLLVSVMLGFLTLPIHNGLYLASATLTYTGFAILQTSSVLLIVLSFVLVMLLSTITLNAKDAAAMRQENASFKETIAGLNTSRLELLKALDTSLRNNVGYLGEYTDSRGAIKEAYVLTDDPTKHKRRYHAFIPLCILPYYEHNGVDEGETNESYV